MSETKKTANVTCKGGAYVSKCSHPLSREEQHRFFAGEVFLSDYDMYTPHSMSSMTKRILDSNRFNLSCAVGKPQIKYFPSKKSK